jgi:hypothetical protein
VTTPTSGKLFSYHDRNGAELSDAPPFQAVKRVRIAFAIQLKNPTQPGRHYRFDAFDQRGIS